MVHWGWRDVKEEAAGQEPVTGGAGDKGDAGCTFEGKVFNKGDMDDTFGFLIAPEGFWERPCDWGGTVGRNRGPMGELFVGGRGVMGELSVGRERPWVGCLWRCDCD